MRVRKVSASCLGIAASETVLLHRSTGALVVAIGIPHLARPTREIRNDNVDGNWTSCAPQQIFMPQSQTSPWKLGGLSLAQLGKRTWNEINKDDVIGRAA